MLKNAAAHVLVRSKALAAFRHGASTVDHLLKRSALAPRAERGALIFMFHGVAEEPSPYRYQVSRAYFQGFCDVVAEHYDVLPLAELESRRRAGALPARAVAITFDDGYADNHDVAWPILKHHGLPATVFVSTAAIGGEKLLWFHRLAHIFQTTQPAELPVNVGPWTFTLDTDGERETTVHRVAADLKKMAATEREEWLARLSEALGVHNFSPLKSEMLSWDQLRAMDAAGFCVEPHTVTHPILGAETIDVATREIAESREILSHALGRKVSLFAYPNGKNEDMTPDVIRAVENVGFTAAFTAEFGAACPSNDPFKVPRVTAYAPTIAELELQIERFFYKTV
ncbi:MAG: polysaccharide deacetylase family protein [Polyangiaceae bacterium]|nr:polysaccharide deacetylase family protein [Polyangiaceae bacterium]